MKDRRPRPALTGWLTPGVRVALSATAVAGVAVAVFAVVLLAVSAPRQSSAQTLSTPTTQSTPQPDPTPIPSATATGAAPTRSSSTPVLGPQTGGEVFAVGDSVMVGAVSQLHAVMPNSIVDAQVSRFFDTMASIVRTRKNNGTLAPIVVIHAGGNGWLQQAPYDSLLDDLADRRLVVLVTMKESRPSNLDRVAANNAVIWATAEHHANAVVADWYGISVDHDEYFSNIDGWLMHLSPAGAVAFANLIAAKVASAPDAENTAP